MVPFGRVKRDGEIEHVELLLTPDAAINGMPENPRVLYSRDCKGTSAEGTPEYFSCDLGSETNGRG